MLCQKCLKNQANYYYKQTINGVTKEIALCSDCAAKESGDNNSLWKKINDEFITSPFESSFFGNGFPGSNLFGSLFTSALPGHESHEEKKCPLCASTFRDIKRMGKAGCAKCYETFAEELTPTIRSIHGKASHTGRRPKKI